MGYRLNQSFYGRGKLLISGEYFVLDGAKALAIPLSLGQTLKVYSKKSFNPCLHWISYDYKGDIWFEAKFELWRFRVIESNAPEAELEGLQQILRQVRKQNPHFLREDDQVKVETHLGFPLEWGLGSSSSLLFNIAQWAYISPFELAQETLGGSGYDIACAQSNGPIVYQLDKTGPSWSTCNIQWPFKDQLYFIYLGNKKKSSEAVDEYTRKRKSSWLPLVDEVSKICDQLLACEDFDIFCQLLKYHEDLIGTCLGKESIQEERFSDFKGQIKSLGAWGGDFALVASKEWQQDVFSYFKTKGIQKIFTFNQLTSSNHSPLVGANLESQLNPNYLGNHRESLLEKPGQFSPY